MMMIKCFLANRVQPVLYLVSYYVGASVLVFATAGIAQYAGTNPSPRGNASSWLDIQAAPPALMKKLKKKEVIKIRFVLSVGPDGRAAGCTHDGRKKLAKQFGELTCSQLTRRARFTPAKDAQGSPVNGTYSSVATWSAPRETGL